MLTTVTVFTSHGRNFYAVVVVVRTLKMDSRCRFQVCSPVLLRTVTVLCVRAPGLAHLTAFGPELPISSLLHPWQPPYCSLSVNAMFLDPTYK